MQPPPQQQPAPTQNVPPNPQQLKLQMAALVNQRNALAKQNALQAMPLLQQLAARSKAAMPAATAPPATPVAPAVLPQQATTPPQAPVAPPQAPPVAQASPVTTPTLPVPPPITAAQAAAGADPGIIPGGIRASATAKIVKKDGQVTETPQAPTPEASPAEAGPQRPAEPVEVPAPDKGVLLHTKVNGADREIAANATAEFAKTNAPQATLSRYQSSTEQKQARIRDRLLQASKDQDFQAENMDLMQHMDAIRHVRSRSALEAHITDASPETQAFLKRYFGPKWAKTVWNKK
jgi:hypothetical protein